jgi:neutral ceramidase
VRARGRRRAGSHHSQTRVLTARSTARATVEAHGRVATGDATVTVAAGRTTMPASGWRAGVSKICITPDEPICLDGWGSRISQGVSMDIWVKAAAFAAGADAPVHVLVTADLCGFSGSMTERLVAWATEAHGMARSQLVLNCSHNHSGPVFEDTLPLYHDLPDDEYLIVARYTRRLEERVRAAISGAIAALAPARVAWGQSLCGFAVNRRRSRGNDTRSLPTVVDQDVPVLTIRAGSGTGGALIGCLFGYSCHATAINDEKVNGDYCGHACAAIEAAHPGAVALFVAGCGADCNPLPRLDPAGELGRMYGIILAAAVEEVLEAPEQEVEHGAGASGVYSAVALAASMESSYGECSLPFEAPPTRAELVERLADTAEGSAERRQLRYHIDLLDDTAPDPMRAPRLFTDTIGGKQLTVKTHSHFGRRPLLTPTLPNKAMMLPR